MIVVDLRILTPERINSLERVYSLVEARVNEKMHADGV